MTNQSVASVDAPASSRDLPLVPRSARVRRNAIGFDAATLVRITRMAFAHRTRMALALAATVLAAVAQLSLIHI